RGVRGPGWPGPATSLPRRSPTSAAPRGPAGRAGNPNAGALAGPGVQGVAFRLGRGRRRLRALARGGAVGRRGLGWGRAFDRGGGLGRGGAAAAVAAGRRAEGREPEKEREERLAHGYLVSIGTWGGPIWVVRRAAPPGLGGTAPALDTVGR